MIITAQDYYVVRKLKKIADRANEGKPLVIEIDLLKKINKKIPLTKN